MRNLITGASIPPTLQADMDAALATLQTHKDEWVALGVRERIGVLDQMIEDMMPVSDRWVAAGLAARKRR